MSNNSNGKFVLFNGDIIEKLFYIDKNAILTLLNLFNEQNSFVKNDDNMLHLNQYNLKNLTYKDEHKELCLIKGVRELLNCKILMQSIDEFVVVNEELINYRNKFKVCKYKNYFYFKIDNNTIDKFLCLLPRDIRLLLFCIGTLVNQEENLLVLNSDYKKILSDRLKYSINTLNKSICKLKELNILLKLRKTKYILNPNILIVNSDYSIDKLMNEVENNIKNYITSEELEQFEIEEEEVEIETDNIKLR